MTATNRSMPAPVFVIGAQKAGTTTLAMDLMACDRFFVDIDLKESSPLLTPHHAGWKNDFETQYRACRPDQRPADISTRYSMAPDENVDFRNVAEWGTDALVLYVARNRLERSVSHHHHDTVLGLTDLSLDDALTASSTFVRNSLYAEQVTRWLEHIEPAQVRIISFESYIANREQIVTEICAAAGVDAAGAESIDAATTFNKTAGRPTPTGLVKQATKSSVYATVRKRMPMRYRQLARRLLSSAAPDREGGPNQETAAALRPIFDADRELLVQLLPKGCFLGFE